MFLPLFLTIVLCNRKGWLSILIKSSVVPHHYYIYIRRNGRLQLGQLFSVGVQDYIIRVHPHAILHSSLRKRVIAGGRKVVNPFKIINLVRIFACNSLCVVITACIYNYDLVYKTPNTVKTAAPTPFLRS